MKDYNYNILASGQILENKSIDISPMDENYRATYSAVVSIADNARKKVGLPELNTNESIILCNSYAQNLPVFSSYNNIGLSKPLALMSEEEMLDTADSLCKIRGNSSKQADTLSFLSGQENSYFSFRNIGLSDIDFFNSYGQYRPLNEAVNSFRNEINQAKNTYERNGLGAINSVFGKQEPEMSLTDKVYDDIIKNTPSSAELYTNEFKNLVNNAKQSGDVTYGDFAALMSRCLPSITASRQARGLVELDIKSMTTLFKDMQKEIPILDIAKDCTDYRDLRIRSDERENAIKNLFPEASGYANERQHEKNIANMGVVSNNIMSERNTSKTFEQSR